MSVLHTFPRAECFIETGFGGGDTLDLACQQPYREIHSIEIDQSLLVRNGARFLADPRVRLHWGSSPTVLSHLCQPAVSTVFWLDAHYSAGQYTSSHLHDLAQLDPAVGQCAVLAELAIIRAVPWTVWPIILIDDAACFEPDHYEGLYAQHDRAQYPTRQQILAALPAGYVLSQIDDGSGWYYKAVPLETP